MAAERGCPSWALPQGVAKQEPGPDCQPQDEPGTDYQRPEGTAAEGGSQAVLVRHSTSSSAHEGVPDVRHKPSWAALLASPYIRRACQCSLGTAAIMCLISVPTVFHALAVDPVMANPSLILVIFYMVLLVSLSTGQAPVLVAAEQLAGSMVGCACGVGAIYLTLLINGGSYNDSVAKAAAMVILSDAFLFLATVCRFASKFDLAWQFAALTFSITTASSYHAESEWYRFTLYWMAYSGIGGAVAYLCATFVLPITAGSIVRRRLASGLQHTAETLRQALDLMSGEVAPDSGLLAAASGETAARIGLDSGLYPQLEKLYQSATAAGQAIQVAYSHLAYAPLQYDVYRRQRRFPTRPFRLLTTMARSLLNCTMLLVYPAQTGQMRVLLVARRRAELLALAGAAQECCIALGDTLVQNAPASAALEKLTAVEARYAALAAASRFKGSTLTQDRLALDMVLSLLFTVCTRLRRMAVLLPEALGWDQPACLQPVLDHFAPELRDQAREPGQGQEQAGAPTRGHGWDFAALTQIPLQSQDSSPIELLRSALLAAQPKRGASSVGSNAEALQLLAQPVLVQPPCAPPPQGLLPRCLAWLQAHTGVHPRHLALGCQLVAAYTPLLIMLIIPAVDAVFDHHLPWALFVVISVLSPATGAAIFKGLQRLVGTLLAGLLGVTAQYLVFLINGLSYENSVVKFAAMSAVMAVMAGALAAASLKYARYSYVFIIAAVVLAITALPGYQTNETRPLIAAWRAGVTALGVLVEVLAVSIVLPVTARQIFRSTMASTLDRMATVARTAFASSFLPKRPPQMRKPSQHLHQQQSKGQQGQQQQTNGQAPRASPFEQPLPPPVHAQHTQQVQHVAIEVQGGQTVQLRAVRTKPGPHQLQQQQQQPARRSSSGGGPGPLSLSPLSPLSPLGSSVRRRRCQGGGEGVNGTGGDGDQAWAAGGGAPCGSPTSPASPASDGGVSGLTINATFGEQLTFKIIGSVYARLLPDAFSTSGGIVAMLQLGHALHYEYYLFSAWHRFPFEPGFRAQRLCRHMLNVLAGAVIVLDSHEVNVLPMLVPFAPRLELLIEQLAVCLEALAAMVRRECPPDRAVETVLAVEEHVQRLFLAVLAAELPAELAEADVINGLALLSVLINASYVARLLALALLRTFYALPAGSSKGAVAAPAPAEAALLEGGRATRWAADDRTLQLGLGILGVALGAGSSSAASASGGGQTPRRRGSGGAGSGEAGGESEGLRPSPRPPGWSPRSAM